MTNIDIPSLPQNSLLFHVHFICYTLNTLKKFSLGKRVPKYSDLTAGEYKVRYDSFPTIKMSVDRTFC